MMTASPSGRLASLVCAVLWAATAACVTRSAPIVPRVAFLEDRSSSAGEALTAGACAPAFNRVLGFAADSFGTVTVETIDENPLRDSGTPVDVSFSPLRSVADNPVMRNPMQERLLSTARSQFDNVISEPPLAKGTDLLGALELAGRIFARPPISDGPEARYLVICSDMISTSDPLLFYRQDLNQADIDQLLSKLRAAGQVPDWHGVTVHVVGGGMTAGDSINADQARGVEAFWRAYFAATGAHVESYASTLPAFP